MKIPDRPGDVDDYLTAWLGMDPRPRVLTDEFRTILWRNQAAVRLLRSKAELVERDGVLVAGDPQRTAELELFLAGASESGATLCLVPPGGHRHALLRATRIGRTSGRQVIGLEIFAGGSALRADYTGYDVAFGLTRAEHRVVAALIKGVTAEQIAEQNGGSVETIRTHIRNVYAKMAVASREGMFHKLAPFRII